MAVFPVWGAMVANAINSMNRKGVGLIGTYVKERATKKDKLIGLVIMFGVAIVTWIMFIALMLATN